MPPRHLTPMMSTGKDDWQTPPALFRHYDETYHFTVDRAANADNALCREWYGPGSPRGEDALVVAWADVGWCNPPYGAAQKAFVEKAAFAAAEANVITVMLLPARPDTKMFHRYIWDKARRKPWRWVRALDFLEGRLTFVGAPAPAPFPSMVVTFGGLL